MYKEDIIKWISNKLGNDFIIPCLAGNIFKDYETLKITTDSYTQDLNQLTIEELTIIKIQIKQDGTTYYNQQRIH